MRTVRRQSVVPRIVIACVAMTGAGCSGQNAESCAALQQELNTLSAKTQDVTQTWQKIEDLQITVTRMVQIEAKLASDCAQGS